MKETFKVKQDHIEHGERSNCQSCPVALAIREKYPESDKITVSSLGITVSDQISRIPEKVVVFIRRFDEYGAHNTSWKPEPFEFELDLHG